MTTTQNIHIQLTIDGHSIEAAVPLPTTPSPRRLLLPTLQNLTNTIVTLAEQSAALKNETVSCKKGCDACCRQMVPISPPEAHALAYLLEAMDPPTAQKILNKFDAAITQLEDAKLLELLQARHTLTPDQLKQLDILYFAAQIPCPFLEDHACSIHANRPLACREFIVSSHPKHCSTPGSGKVRQIPLPAKVSLALAKTDPTPWLPLPLARHFVSANKERTPKDLPESQLKKILNAL
jgi:Fe-S-cluster containining protein